MVPLFSGTRKKIELNFQLFSGTPTQRKEISNLLKIYVKFYRAKTYVPS